jgi:hypothetical protein
VGSARERERGGIRLSASQGRGALPLLGLGCSELGRGGGAGSRPSRGERGGCWLGLAGRRGEKLGPATGPGREQVGSFLFFCFYFFSFPNLFPIELSGINK